MMGSSLSSLSTSNCFASARGVRVVEFLLLFSEGVHDDIKAVNHAPTLIALNGFMVQFVTLTEMVDLGNKGPGLTLRATVC